MTAEVKRDGAEAGCDSVMLRKTRRAAPPDPIWGFHGRGAQDAKCLASKPITLKLPSTRPSISVKERRGKPCVEIGVRIDF